MTNTKQIVLLASLALALSTAQTYSQQVSLGGTDAPVTGQVIDQAVSFADWIKQHPEQAPSVGGLATATPVNVTTATPAVTTATPTNVEIIQNLDKTEDSIGKIKGLYTLMQQAAGQQFDEQSQKAFAIALVNAFNDARTANAYILQLLQAASQTSLLNTEQQKYVKEIMLPLVANKTTAAPAVATAQTTAVPTTAVTTETAPAATTPATTTTTVVPTTTTTTAPVTTVTTTVPVAKATVTTTPAAKTTVKATAKPAAKKTTKKVVKKVVKKAAKKVAKPVAKTTVTTTTPATTTVPVATTTSAVPVA